MAEYIEQGLLLETVANSLTDNPHKVGTNVNSLLGVRINSMSANTKRGDLNG